MERVVEGLDRRPGERVRVVGELEGFRWGRNWCKIFCIMARWGDCEDISAISG